VKFSRTIKVHKGYLDMTPLIDVVFLLLIFFMLSSSFILQSGIKVELPNAVSSESLKNTHTIITILQNKGIYVNDKPVAMNKLPKVLEDFSKDSVIIQADGGVELDTVVSVWDICRRIGVKAINIATKQKTYNNI